MTRLIQGMLYLFLALPAWAEPSDGAITLAKQVNERYSEGVRVGVMKFKLTNRAGRVRVREALMMKHEKRDAIRIAIYFTAPAGIADTAFLSHDYLNKQDTSWLYLPATERVRRLPASDRGDNFMGTDLSYGDVKDHFRFSENDWDFSTADDPECQKPRCNVLTGEVKNSSVAQEIGYSRFIAFIDLKNYFPVYIRYYDPEGSELKTVDVHRLEQVGDAWMATELTILNVQTQHQTELVFENTRYLESLPLRLFTANAISDGPPVID